jgi:hypothetical protein
MENPAKYSIGQQPGHETGSRAVHTLVAQLLDGDDELGVATGLRFRRAASIRYTMPLCKIKEIARRIDLEESP